jgi:hypothetical protein
MMKDLRMLKKFIALLCAYALALFPLPSQAVESTGTPVSMTYVALGDNAAPIANPDRYEGQWAGGDIVASYDAASVASSFSAGYRLLKCHVNLVAFRTTAISGAFLSSLQTQLNLIRSAGMKCILDFTYNQDSSGLDATAAQIASHLGQLKTTLYANADVIPYLKAGFIGAWGEWHSSTSGNSCGYNPNGGVPPCPNTSVAANRVTVRDALLLNVHPLTAVQFRYPSDVMDWYPTPLATAQAYNGSAQARTGHGNDCMLSNQDSGTWGDSGSGGASYTGAQKMSYVDTTTLNVPYGGETTDGCAAPLKLTCNEAFTDFARWHLSWLMTTANSMNSFRTAWAAGGCTNKIANLMGYRIEYRTLIHQGSANRGESITATLTLRNVGWSRVHRPFRVQLVMTMAGQPSIICPARVDLRSLPPQATAYSTIAIPCTIPANAVVGVRQVHLRIPDIWPNTQSNAAFAIRPAIAATGTLDGWDPTNFRWVTGLAVTVN